MIPTQNTFMNQLPNAYAFQQPMFNPSLNLALMNQLRNSFTPMPLNYGVPNLSQPFFPNFSNTLSLIKLQQDLQAQLTALHSAKLPKMEDITSYSKTLKSVSSASPQESVRSETKPEQESALVLPNDPDICLEAQVKYMIQFFINNFGIASSQELKQAKEKYSQNSKLVELFEALVSKYTTITKTREEMIKWIIRRCLKTSKNSMKKEQKKDQKKALKDLCTRYFKEDGSESNGEEEEADSGFVDRVLPFRKNSKNKTMNNSFIIEIFQSEVFRNDYKEFLKDLDEISDKENSEKINRFTSFVVQCAKKGNFGPIAKYKRVPWLKLWNKNTKRVAQELDEGDFEGKGNKKVKAV
jgi:hypothetical protein